MKLFTYFLITKLICILQTEVEVSSTVNICLFHKLYLMMDINRTQELCVKCITKDCHVILYVFNMI